MVMAMVGLMPRPKSPALTPRIRMPLRIGRISRARTLRTDVGIVQDECGIVDSWLALLIV